MSKTVKFENSSIEVQQIEGVWMFELYSVGMALGQVRTAKGKAYAAKSRIDNNVKNAEIKPVVHNAQLFLTESQVYDLMLETRTDKCRAFRKWLTTEVLPELNHTGTYSVNKNDCQQLTFADYEYFDKTYNGQPVLTTEDIGRLAGVNRSTISWHLKKPEFKHGTDYYRLEGRTLAEFKRENPKYTKMTSTLNVITKSGFDKLVKHFSIKVDTPKLFIEEKPAQPPEPAESQYTASDAMVNLLGYIDRQMILIAEYRRRLLDPCSLQEARTYKKNLAEALYKLRCFRIDTETIRLV